MATHDYVIDNQTAPNFRADLNSALQAIVTQNSSGTAPSVTYANMIWYDSANNQLKKRDEANSSWVTLGTIDEGTGTFTPSGSPPVQTQATWNTGTSTTESTITPEKLDDKIENKLNVSGSAPMYACRAWVNFKGTGTVAIRASGNVSSITDNGTGNYTVNFTTAMPDANYAAACNGGESGSNISRTPYVRDKTTTSCVVRTTVLSSGSSVDVDICDIAFFR
jgi:hypothetical protein